MKILFFVITMVISFCMAEPPLETTTLPDPHQAPTSSDEVKGLEEVDCSTMNNAPCTDCLNLHHCKFVQETSACVDKNSTLGSLSYITSLAGCPTITVKADATNTTTTTASTTQASTTQSPNSTVTSTTSPNSTSTETTPITSTTANGNTTTTANGNTTTTTTTPLPSTSSDPTNSTTTTQPPSTTTSSASSTTKAPEGSRFDSWSFFGGILLTIGVSAIGFVSLRYYKARTGQIGATNYNRF